MTAQWIRWSLVCILIFPLCARACSGEEPAKSRPGRVIPMLGAGKGNLVPNASFECGDDRWGSAELDSLPGWYGPLNGLFGHLDTRTAAHGRASLKIELTLENQPIAYNDYLHVSQKQIKAPLAANVGWIAVKPGQRYTFSVAMKAAEAGTPARLVVRQFYAAPFEKMVKLSTDWERYSLEFTPDAEACYVLAGPDLRQSQDNTQPPAGATVWLDAVQLTTADDKTAFATRQPVELGVRTDKPGNIFAEQDSMQLHLSVASTDASADRKADIELRLTDFFDEEVWRDTTSVVVPAGTLRDVTVVVPPSPQRRGYLRLHATMTSGTTVEERTLRLATIPVYSHADSRFGLNHAFAWPDMLTLCRQAGVLWMRDWSPKWQDVEPEKGRFTFAEADAQIDRILKESLRVMCVLAFPSSNWSSSAPASVPPSNSEPRSQAPDAERQRDDILVEVGTPYARMGYAPRDMAEFENYVSRTVDHYKDRIHDWQVFNEPIYTPYSLPKAAGYTTADYIRHIEAFVRAARLADPQCRILGGYCLGFVPSNMMEEPEQFITLGGLKHLDVLTLHDYPLRTAPEGIEPSLQRLGALMDEHGTRRPIWFTETAYWADDEPWSSDINASYPVVASERIQAEYLVRLNAILLANGVEKIFFHAGTGSAINHGNVYTMFLRYGSEPYKCYTTQAIMSQLFTPSCKFVKRLLPGEPVHAYLFRDTKRTVAVVWAPAGTPPQPLELADARLQVWDIVGRPQTCRTFRPSETPVYVVGEDISPDEFEKMLAPDTRR